MPLSPTPAIGKTDAALTSTSAGDILKSFGPAAVPVVAVPSTDYSVPAAAERWTGLKTHAALQRVDWTGGAWTGGIFQAISPPDLGVTPDFNWSFATASVGQDPQDHIINLGWNSNEGGGSADGTRPSWSIQFESAFYGNYSETVPQFEWHLQFTRPDTSQVVRSITATVLHDGSHCDLGLSGDQVHFRDHTGAEMLTWTWPNMFILGSNSFTQATPDTRWLKQRTSTGADASLIRMGTSDTIRIGESQIPAVTIAFGSPVSTMLLANPVDIQVKNNVGTVSSLLNIDTTNAMILRPPGSAYYVTAAGKFTQMTSSGFNSYLRFDASGLMLGQASASDGTQKFSLYGGTPVVQPTGGTATAAATYGSNEQLMLQTVYNAVRAWKGMS